MNSRSMKVPGVNTLAIKRRPAQSLVLAAVLVALGTAPAVHAAASQSLGRSLERLAPPAAAGEATDAPSQAEVLDRYRKIEDRVVDEPTRAAVQQRMAELEMAAGEERDIAGEKNAYVPAIRRYEALLDRTSGSELEAVLYQLARAYDLSGRIGQALQMFDRLLAEFPGNPWRVEALFRRAEIHFSNDRYEPAARDYAQVVTDGTGSPYHQNARYMLGWSWFKQSAFEEGLDQFLPLIAELQVAPSQRGETAPSRAEQELLDDTLRATVLSLQYLDGPKTLAERMDALDRPDWQYTVYAHLAERYVRQERWQEGARTWSTYVDQNPLAAQAPQAQQALIDVLEAGNFPSDARAQKEQYVARFGADSPWRQAQPDTVRETVAESLRLHLATLANESHVAVQAQAKRQSAGSSDYLAAARWYEASLLSFPDSEDAARQLLLLGDLYTQAGEDRRAVAAYRQLLEEHARAPEARDAAYALVLALRSLHDRGENGDHELSLRMLVDAQIGFAMDHREDPRAPVVQAAAANDLFSLQEYGQAMTLATNLLQTWPQAEPDLLATVWSILGHARFETADFAGAEAAYDTLLPLSGDADKRAAVTERLLASVYKQGELAEKRGATDEAVGHFLRLGTIAPAAEIAVRGAFDAVALREKQGDTEGAAALLSALRKQHPQHALLKDANVRLAAMYEQSGDPSQAANELVRLADTATDPEIRRQSRYRAAELLAQSGQARQAAEQFERYVRDHMDPVATRVEGMNQLVLLAAARGDGRAVRQWRQRIIDTQAAAGAAGSTRMATLAAQARYELALQDRAAFDEVSLRAPLASTLKQKRERLQRAVASFEAVVNYQVQDVTTAATFQIADLYRALAGAIMTSQRPSGLSAAELEEYNLLLEEEAYPFEEKAIAIHELNSQRSWEGVYDTWVRKSFDELRRLLPGRFDKAELQVSDVREIR